MEELGSEHQRKTDKWRLVEQLIQHSVQESVFQHQPEIKSILIWPFLEFSSVTIKV